MTIETKYNIGDKVWGILGNKVQCTTITNIRVSNDSCFTNEYGEMVGTEMNIQYYLLCNAWVDEENLFSTKEELLKSL